MPEAQLDRFLMKISMGNLSVEEERKMIDRFIVDEPLKKVTAVASAEQIRLLQEECRKVYVHNDLRDYMVALVQATRKHESGVSPRGTLALLRAAQGYAYVSGRDFVEPEDIKTIAIPVLCHRMISEEDEKRKKMFIEQLLQSVPLPTEDWGLK